MAEVARETWANPEIAARRREALKAAWADPALRERMKAKPRGPYGPGPRFVDVPKWVPADLVSDFLNVAARRGEEAAASHVRKVKRERAEANNECQA
jgi:hypothetical protein